MKKNLNLGKKEDVEKIVSWYHEHFIKFQGRTPSVIHLRPQSIKAIGMKEGDKIQGMIIKAYRG